MSITRIELPPAVALLERFSFPTTATSGDGVEITVRGGGTRIATCDGRHGVVIETPSTGDAGPFLVAMADLAKSPPGRPVVLFVTSPTTAVMEVVDGSLA